MPKVYIDLDLNTDEEEGFAGVFGNSGVVKTKKRHAMSEREHKENKAFIKKAKDFRKAARPDKYNEDME